MRKLLLMAASLVALLACQSEPKDAGSGSHVSKQQLLAALTDVCGKRAAEEHFREWMEAYGHTPGTNEADDDVLYSAILEQIKRGNPSPAAMKQEIVNTRDRLLHKTDHNELLAACRQVMKTRRSYRPDPTVRHYGMNGAPGVPDPEVTLPAPNDPKLPDMIRVLKPEFLYVSDEDLRMAFEPGFHNMGFIAYAAGITNTPAGASNRRFRKVIDGLWFFEEADRK